MRVTGQLTDGSRGHRSQYVTHCQLCRKAIFELNEKNGVPTDGYRLHTVIMRADVDAYDAALHSRQMIHVAFEQPVTDVGSERRKATLWGQVLITRSLLRLRKRPIRRVRSVGLGGFSAFTRQLTNTQ